MCTRRGWMSVVLRSMCALAATQAARSGTKPGRLAGDLNCDNGVDFADINPFVLALADPAAYARAYPDCDRMLADVNGDGVADFRDINPFVVLLAGGGVPPTAVELAGNSLDEYPYFEYVKAFNENATIEVALDPTRYVGIVDQSADLYVVEARNADEWLADPALVDVTVDGPLTVTFGGTTVQENTFVVAGPYELESAAFEQVTADYTGLGHGYDVIVDFDRNGQLDAGDYMDGWGTEAGLYVVHDPTQPGPLAVSEATYSGGYWLDQVLYYPTNISAMGLLPIVIISHGTTHHYLWYDHIGYHLASYGYVVMSHSNDCAPGVEAASTTTLDNTAYLLEHLDTIAFGVLEGHVDTHRITWIGHSRGGEGVVRAYDRLCDGPAEPTSFTADDIVLISSMAPTDTLGTGSAEPHGVPYHLWTGAADTIVYGAPISDNAQTFHLHDRATGFRHSTVLHGVGHSDFHHGGGSSATGPCLLGPPNTHLILKGYFLPLIEYYAEGNIAASDFLWRQWERFKPIGAPSFYCDVTDDDGVVVNNTFRNGAEGGNFMIDDYQTGESLDLSSSGGAVNFTVQHVTEGRLDDNDASFAWTASDPMNGMTYARPTDTTRGVVFDWNGVDCYYEWAIIAGQRDFRDDRFLSFRACQGTRHPYTTAVLGDLTFSVTLRDAAETTSSINIGAYGGGLEEPYQRAGNGEGAGWHNDFEVIRIRLTDFLANGAELDLADIVAIRFDVGPAWGSNEGRIGVDELMLTNDPAPPGPRRFPEAPRIHPAGR